MYSLEERTLTGTWYTTELVEALDKGYRIAEIYEVWHFNCSSDTLFSDYIKMHPRQKQEALGFPHWCTDKLKKKNTEQYIKEFRERHVSASKQD